MKKAIINGTEYCYHSGKITIAGTNYADPICEVKEGRWTFNSVEDIWIFRKFVEASPQTIIEEDWDCHGMDYALISSIVGIGMVFLISCVLILAAVFSNF